LEITWLGHSCFRIKGKSAVVITDPCHPSLGYSLDKLQADMVTLSHSHPGHCYIEAITGEFKQIKGPGEYEIKSTFITGIATFHDADRGETRGKNTVYLIEMDGMTLCHLGDLGHPLSSDVMEEIDDVEVLFLPVGGVSTIGSSTAAEIVRHLTPKIVIPMHYKTPSLTVELEPVDKFLKELGVNEIAPQSKLSVTLSNLPSSTKVIIFDYPH